MHRRVTTWSALLASGAAVAGCALVLGFEDTKPKSDNDGGPDGDAMADGPTTDARADAGPASLTATPSPLVVRRGKTTPLVVKVARGNVQGALTVSLNALPAGLTAAPATLAANASQITLDVKATAMATVGPATATLLVDPPSVPGIELPLLVADAAGALDSTFGTAGAVVDGTRGLGGTFYGLTIDASSRVLACGAGASPVGWMVRRFTNSGAVDALFNAAAAGLPTNGECRGIAIDDAGRVVLVGTSTPIAGVPALTVARLDAAGKLDATFGGTGVVRLDPVDGGLGSEGYGLATLAGGNVVAVGVRHEGTDDSGIVTRWKANGQPDTTFATGGQLVVAKNAFVGVRAEAGGAMVVAGTDATGQLGAFYLTRRTATGGPDTTFGLGGALTFGLGYRAFDFALQPDGAWVVVGDDPQSDQAFTAGRASPAGAQVWVHGFTGGKGAAFHAVAAQTDGRIVAAGNTTPPNGEARVDRLLPDAGRDTTFGTGGTAILETAAPVNGVDMSLNDVLIQADGRILVAGNRTNGGAIVLRLWP